MKSALDMFRANYSASFFINSENDLSEEFQGDTFTVATVYRDSLDIETREYGVCGRTIQNARIRTMLQLSEATVKCPENPCVRCGGTGLMPFRHVKNGLCFKCGGTGKNRKD